MTDQISQRDIEIESLKNEKYELENQLIETQQNTSRSSDEEFQSAIDNLTMSIQEVRFLQTNQEKKHFQADRFYRIDLALISKLLAIIN